MPGSRLSVAGFPASCWGTLGASPGTALTSFLLCTSVSQAAPGPVASLTLSTDWTTRRPAPGTRPRKLSSSFFLGEQRPCWPYAAALICLGWDSRDGRSPPRPPSHNTSTPEPVGPPYSGLPHPQTPPSWPGSLPGCLWVGIYTGAAGEGVARLSSAARVRSLADPLPCSSPGEGRASVGSLKHGLLPRAPTPHPSPRDKAACHSRVGPPPALPSPPEP